MFERKQGDHKNGTLTTLDGRDQRRRLGPGVGFKEAQESQMPRHLELRGIFGRVGLEIELHRGWTKASNRLRSLLLGQADLRNELGGGYGGAGVG